MIVFLNPLTLFALVLAAVPVAVHLLRKKQIVCEIPSLLLFTGRKHLSQRRRIEDLLLLILRCLIVLFIVLLPAHPVIRWKSSAVKGGFEHSSTLVAVLLDDLRPAAGFRFSARSAFDLLKTQTAAQLNSLPPDSKVMLSGTSGALLSAPVSPAEAVRHLSRMTLSDDGPDLPRVLRSLSVQLRDRAEKDFRSVSLLAAIPPLAARWTPLAGDPVFPAHAWNIVSAGLEPDFMEPVLLHGYYEEASGLILRFSGAPAALAASVIEISSETPASFRRFPLSAQEILSGRKLIPSGSLPPGERLTVQILPQTGKGAVPVSRFAVWYLTRSRFSSALPRVQILYDGSPAMRLPVLTLHAAFDNLYPQRFELSVCDLRSSAPPASFRRSDCVVVPPFSGPSSALNAYLRKAAADGASMMFFPQSFDLAPALRSLPPERLPVWLPASTLTAPRPLVLSGDPAFRMAFFSLFNKGVSAVELQTLCPLRPAEGDRPLFLLDRSPVLSVRPLDSGSRLFLWSVPFGVPPLSLVMNPLFPRLLADVVLSGSDSSASASLHTGDSVALADLFASRPVQGGFTCLTPGSRTPLKLFCTSSDRTEFPLDSPGFYELRHGSSAPVFFAVNDRRMDPALLTFSSLPARAGIPSARLCTVEGGLQSAPLRHVETPVGISVADGVEERDLLPWCAGILVLLLCVEVLLAAVVAGRRPLFR